MSTENVTEYLDFEKKGNDFYVFISVKNKQTKISCFGFSLIESLKKISIESDPNSVLHILDKTCNFDITMNDLKKENRMTKSTIGGVTGGLVLIIIIISIIIFVIKRKHNKEKEVTRPKAYRCGRFVASKSFKASNIL